MSNNDGIEENQIEEFKEESNNNNNGNGNGNEGVSPASISTNKPIASNNTSAAKTQSVGNLSQAEKDSLSQKTIQQNLEGERKALQENENLKLLKRIVGKASPIVEEQQEIEEQTDANGNKVQVPVIKKVTTGYSYYAVNGQQFTDWVQETFNGKISIDTKNNKIIYNEQPGSGAGGAEEGTG